MLSNRRTFVATVGVGAGALALPQSASARPIVSRLPRTTPEAEGVSSQGILDFINAIEASEHELHSLMILRHGTVITEGWWAPYRREFNHGMYSMSKSFTSTAIGFAVAEKRLTVNDKVTSFFPDDLPEEVSDRLQQMTVKHLLTMSDGQKRGSTGKTIASDDWVKNFLSQPLVNEPGSMFSYNSGATYMLSAIVQKLTGQTLLEYLNPRLFEPLGISGMYWEKCPKGINVGGWGLHIRTEGLAHLGQLYLQKGMWNGKRLMYESWIEEATAKQIQQPKNEKKPNPDWEQGYGYQFWRCRHGLYRGDGAFGQYAIVLPEQDAVIVMTGESANMRGELELVYEHLLPAFDKRDTKAIPALRSKLKSLAIKLPSGRPVSPTAERVHGKQFEIAENKLGIQSVAFEFFKGSARMMLKHGSRNHSIACGIGDWILGSAVVPDAPPRIIAGGAPEPGTKAPIAAAGAWADENTFVMHWRYYETPHHDTVTCRFDGDKVAISFLRSIIKIRGGKKDPRPDIQGRMI